MFSKIRVWIIKKLLKDIDGYTFTGVQESQPIKFYYCETNNTYYMGIRSGNMYYARPSVSGWCLEMSRYLPWGETNADGYTYPNEPQEIEFRKWIHGVLDTVHEQYLNLSHNKKA